MQTTENINLHLHQNHYQIHQQPLLLPHILHRALPGKICIQKLKSDKQPSKRLKSCTTCHNQSERKD